MDTVILQAPEGVTSCSAGGQQFDADDKGQVTVPVAYFEHLAQFGFVAVSQEDLAKAEAERLEAERAEQERLQAEADAARAAEEEQAKAEAERVAAEAAAAEAAAAAAAAPAAKKSK